jgi:hypothetical protein
MNHISQFDIKLEQIHYKTNTNPMSNTRKPILFSKHFHQMNPQTGYRKQEHNKTDS